MEREAVNNLYDLLKAQGMFYENEWNQMSNDIAYLA